MSSLVTEIPARLLLFLAECPSRYWLYKIFLPKQVRLTQYTCGFDEEWQANRKTQQGDDAALNWSGCIQTGVIF